MSDGLRIALVAEGKSEHEVIGAALKVILAPRSFVLVPLQPEATKPDMGSGWGGVLKWCHQLAARSQHGNREVESDPTLSNFDGVVLQLDADVATFAYSQLRPPVADAEARSRGWQPLPGRTACPPAQLPQDALFNVLLSWLSPAVPGTKTVVCIPAMNTGAWQAAAKLPAGNSLLVDLECRADIEAKLQGLPLKLRVDKKKPESRLDAAKAVTLRWTAVTATCSRAQAFDQAIRVAFP